MSTAIRVRLVPAPPPLPADVQDGRTAPPPRAAPEADGEQADGGPADGGPADRDPADRDPAPGGPARGGPAPGGPPGERPAPGGQPDGGLAGGGPPGTARRRAVQAPPGRTLRRAPAEPVRDVAGGAPELDPRQACCMVALAAVEVLAGNRPLAQLARWLTPEVYDGLARRAVLTAPGTRVLDAAAGARELAADSPDPVPAGAARRPSVRRVRVHRVDAHTVESSVVVAHAGRVRAVAVRLTRSTGRWRASALVVG